MAQSTAVSVRVNKTSASSTTSPWTDSTLDDLSARRAPEARELPGSALLTGQRLDLGLVEPEHQ